MYLNFIIIFLNIIIFFLLFNIKSFIPLPVLHRSNFHHRNNQRPYFNVHLDRAIP